MGTSGSRRAAPPTRQASPQTRAAPARAIEPAPTLARMRLGGPGKPLPPSTRQRMERAFASSFEDVRVHDGADAAAVAREHGAEAFTLGCDIVFGAGKYRPDTPSGDHLIAHELTHVVQQSGSSGAVAQPRSEHSQPGEADELQAEAVASRVLRGQPAGIQRMGSAVTTRQRIMRRALPGATPSAADENRLHRHEDEIAEPPAPGPSQPGAHSGESARTNTIINATRVEAALAVEPLMPPPPERLGPEAQKRLKTAQQAAAQVTAARSALPGADDSTASARSGVTEPREQKEAQASNALVAALDERPSPSPELEALCQRIYDLIRSKRPPNEASLVDSSPEEAANEAGAQLDATIEGDVERVGGSYEQLQEGQQAAAAVPGTPVETPRTAVATPEIHAAAAAPDPVSGESISLDADVEASAARMDDAGMTTASAQLVEEGPIAEACAALGDLTKTAARDPAQVMARQQATIAVARADMAMLQAQALEALHTARAGAIQEIGARQGDMIRSEEQTRASVGAHAQRMFRDAQRQVRALLEPLPRTAMQQWKAGLPALTREFRSRLDSVKARIEERHSGVGGVILEASDALIGLPDWVVEAYHEAEEMFGDRICVLIRNISRDVQAVVAAAEAIIENTRQKIDDLFEALPAELQDWAREQRERFAERLDGLQQEARATRDDFTKDLAQRAAGAVQEVREEIHSLRQTAGGLLERITGTIAAFLEDPGRAIVDGLLRVLGIPPASFWALVDQLGAVVDGIAKDPMGFANTMMAGVGQGFRQFFGNFPAHIGQSLFAWLFSKMGEAGVTMPRDFSIPSIVSLVLDVMGIDWEHVRMLLARHIGEHNVAHIERAYDIITNFIARGPLGLVELMREQLDPAGIVDMIREAAIRYLMESLVTRVAARILMMLNPAGAILQAIEAIYRVLSWIYENAARIFTLIEAVVNGAAQILARNTAGLTALVERALAGLMVPVIDFLADYLGLGGIPAAIRDLVLGLRERVARILDRVIAFIAQRARALLGAMGVGGDTESEEGQPGADSPLPAVPFEAHTGEDGEAEPHRIYVDESGSAPEIMIASAPQRALNQIRNGVFQGLLAGPENADTRNQITALLVQARNLLAGIPSKSLAAQGNAGSAQGNADRTQADEVRRQAHRNMQQVSQLLANLGVSYPLPVVGTYAALTKQAKSERPPDGRTRPAHHVPAHALGKAMRDELSEAAKSFEPPYPDNQAVASVVARLREAVAAMNALVHDGKGLSAILVHPDTHLGGDASIHAESIARPLETELQRHEQAYGVRRLRIMDATGRQLLVNPKKTNWRQFLRECQAVVASRSTRIDASSEAKSGSGLQQMISEARDQLERLDREESRELTHEVLLRAKSTLRQAFVEAYASGEAAVRAALGRSRLDGASPTSVLPDLRREAYAKWRPFHTSIRF
jgi:hypothetical protein